MTGRPDEAEVSALLATAIRDVAGLEIGQDVSFFEAGLTSAMLLRVHERLSRHLTGELPVWLLFKHPTRRSLARCLSTGAAGASPAVPGAPLPGRVPTRGGQGPAGSRAQSRRELRQRILDIGGW